jgi:hypothetical protein
MTSFGIAMGFGSADDAGTAGFKSLQINAAAAPAALGNAFSAVGGDISSLGINPAGIAGLSERTVQVAAADYVLDMARYLLSVSIPTEFGVVAININDMNMGDFERSSTTAQSDGTFSANDIDIQAVVGRSVSWIGRWDIGVATRFISSSIDNYSARALSFDLGLIYHSPSGPSVAAAITNVGTTLSSFDGMDEDLPTAITVGMSHYLAHLPVRVTADISIPRDANIGLSVGAQVNPMAPLFLRVGYRSLLYYDRTVDQESGGTQAKWQFAPSVSDADRRQAFGVSGGLELAWRKFSVDYAYTASDVLEGVHRFSLSGRF